MHNVENLRWAMLQNIDRAFARFGRELRESLDDTIAATKGAIQAACAKREERAEAIAEETAALRRQEKALDALAAALGGGQARECGQGADATDRNHQEK